MRFLVLAGWLFFLTVFVLPMFFSLFRKPLSRKRELGKGADMVRDEVCGIYIPKERAETVKLAGKSYYFCGKECLSKFLAGSG